MTTPPTRLRPRSTPIARLALVLVLVPRLAPLLVRRSQASAHLKTRQRRPCSLVCATSARHHSSCQPRVMHVVLDTSLVVPRSRTQVSLGHLAVYGHIRFPSVCFPFHLYLSLVAPFF